MKKVITVSDLCCERCAKRLVCKLELCDGVFKAKANYKKNVVFVEVKNDFSDDALREAVSVAGFEAVAIAPRKGLFA